MSDTEEVIDLHSMKVTELKQELKSRGLPVSGAKAELIERLENYMQEHEGVEVVEEEETEDSVEKVDEKASDEKAEEPVSNDISVNANESQNNAEAAGSPEPQNDISLAEEDDKDAVKVSVNARVFEICNNHSNFDLSFSKFSKNLTRSKMYLKKIENSHEPTDSPVATFLETQQTSSKRNKRVPNVLACQQQLRRPTLQNLTTKKLSNVEPNDSELALHLLLLLLIPLNKQKNLNQEPTGLEQVLSAAVWVQLDLTIKKQQGQHVLPWLSS